MAGEGVGGLLAHKVCSSRLKFSLERFLFLFCSLVLFPAARTPIRACDRSRSSNLINAIFLEEELGRAQSKPTQSEEYSRSRLGNGQRPRPKVVLIVSLGVFSFLFPSISILDGKSQLFCSEPAGLDSPQIDGQLSGHGHDGFFARSAGGQCAFA